MTTHTAPYEVPEVSVLTVGKYSVREMVLSWQKFHNLWQTLSQFRTLFSDLTRGDEANFMRFITEPNSIWLEICEEETLAGIVCFTRLERIVDADAHILFVDRDLADKVPVCKAIVSWAFDNLPLQRISVQTPFYYYATIRMVKEVGFKIEGEKRKAVLIKGRWANVCQLGILRSEAKDK